MVGPVLIAALLGPTSRGQEPGSDLPARLREGIGRFVADGEISGAVALVGRAEGIVALEAVGRRDLEADRPMRPDTLFRIASMTKPITAIAVMMLADEGKLAIDDPVERHLPEFKGQMLVVDRSGGTVTLKAPSRPITLRDLLTHTSGLPGSPPAGLADLYARRDRSLAEAVIAFSQRPLEFEPGSKWAYCNAGIDTLGRVVEAVSGEPYEAFLRRRLFAPLGMNDTTFFPDPTQLRRSATIYDRPKGDDSLRPVAYPLIGPPEGARYPIPAGGLFATAPDLARLYRMILNRGILDGRRYLSEASVEAMTRLQTGDLATGFVEGMGFGLGWGVVREPKGATEALSPGSFGHGGAFGTQAWIDPGRGQFVVLLFQRVGLGNGDASAIRRELQRIALGERPD